MKRNPILAIAAMSVGVVLLASHFHLARRFEEITPIMPQQLVVVSASQTRAPEAGKAASSVSPAEPNEVKGPILNVRNYGARGDGRTNDTAAIQAAIDAAPQAGAVIYFPAGTYMVGTDDRFGFRVANRANLRFEGEGATTIIKRRPLAKDARIATLDNVSDIVITRLTFDANGIVAYGGVSFNTVKRVKIIDTRFFDSNPHGNPMAEMEGDHYSYVFSGSEIRPGPNEDIQIVNNRIEFLQLEVNGAHRVRIEGNTSLRSPSTAAMGLWAVGDGVVSQDYVITKNTIIEPAGGAIVAQLDSPHYRNNTFRRIRITDNRIRIKTTRWSSYVPIVVGTTDTSVVNAGGNRFENIVVDGNFIEYDPSGPKKETGATIALLTELERSKFEFQRVAVQNNEILGNRRLSEWAIDLRYLTDSVVQRNILRGVEMGVAVDNQKQTRIQDNVVGARLWTYGYGVSRGGNRFERNRYFGNPKNRWDQPDGDQSDVIENPQRIAEPPPRRAGKSK